MDNPIELVLSQFLYCQSMSDEFLSFLRYSSLFSLGFRLTKTLVSSGQFRSAEELRWRVAAAGGGGGWRRRGCGGAAAEGGGGGRRRRGCGVKSDVIT